MSGRLEGSSQSVFDLPCPDLCSSAEGSPHAMPGAQLHCLRGCRSRLSGFQNSWAQGSSSKASIP